jgi:hypothetical protein
VRTQTRATRRIGLSQSRATGAGSSRLEHGDLHGLTSSVEVGSDGGQVGDGSGHASDVFDSFKLQENGGQVNTPGPVRRPSQVLQHLIQGSGVDGGIHPASTVRGHLTELRLQAGNQAIIGVVTTGDAVQKVIILQPQGDIPGCPVCPTVVGFGFGDHGGECLHLVSFD